MKNIFDYTYYRIAKFYFKRDGLESITALLTLTLIMFLYLLSIIFILVGMLEIGYRKTSIIEKIIVLLVMFIIYLYTKKIYKGKYLILREKWKEEPKNIKTKNGFLVIFFILSPLLLIVLIAHYFGRTNF